MTNLALGKGGGGGHGGGHGHGGSSVFIGGGWGGWGGWGWPYAYGPVCDPMFDPFCGAAVVQVPVPVPVLGAGVTIPLSGLGFDPEAHPTAINTMHAVIAIVSIIALIRMGKKKK